MVICEPTAGMSLAVAIYGLIIILGSAFGYRYKPSIFSVAIFGFLAFVLANLMLPYLLGLFGGGCVVV